jgi:tetratricopeptide (TPR) repeat protein
MKIRFASLAVILAVFLISCSPSRDKILESISKMEASMKTSQTVDTNSVAELLSAYQNFATRFADDSLAPEYLYKAAGLAVGFIRGVQAIEIYETIIKTYPSFKKLPECYFMEAFTYENTLGNFGKASEYYNKFLSMFPEHELADDAKSALKFLGKSPEEMVREFEKMNSDSLDTATK